MSFAKHILSNLTRMPRQASVMPVRCMSGKDDGNKAGETLSKKGAADQAQYFRQLEREQLRALKKHHDQEIKEHEEDIKRLQERIQQHKDRLDKLNKHE